MFDCALLSDLSLGAWEYFRDFAVAASSDPDAVPGVIFSIQTYGNLINAHPHLHCISSDGWFS